MNKNKIMIYIIIVVLIAIVGIFEYSKLNYYKTAEAMYELTQNINNYNNLYVHTVYTSNIYGTTEIDRWWKDNEYKEKSNSNENGCAYINSNEKIFIVILEEDKTIKISENYESAAECIINKSINFTGIFNPSTSDNNYKYCGIEDINNNECYKIFIKHKLQESELTLWIEKETGFVIKQETVFNGEIITYENTYEIGNVTNGDIEKPDLQEYKDSGEYELVYE